MGEAMYSTTRLVEIWIEPPFVVACGCKASVYHPDGPANWVGDLWWKGTLVSNVEPRLPKPWGLLASLYPVYYGFSALVKRCTTVQVILFHFPTSCFENALLLSAYQQFWCIAFWLYCIRAFNSSLHAHLFRFCNVGHCGPPPAFERDVWGRAEFASLIHISYMWITSLNKNGIWSECIIRVCG